MGESKEKFRERRETRKAAGLCGRCGKCEPAPGCVNCDECQKYGRRVYKQMADSGLCPLCNTNPPAAGRSVCESCRHKQRIRELQAAGENRCTKCGQPHTAKTKWCHQCLAKQRSRNRQLRNEVFAAYGGPKCNCPSCEVTEPKFLQIDHINNDGAQHRREIGGGSHLYRWLKRNNFPPGFQVMCANCNYAKGKYGCCPHIHSDTDVDNADQTIEV